ncbi:MAG: TetR/AcrR family transcriptional regulator [Acidimicrobiales bacterium]
MSAPEPTPRLPAARRRRQLLDVALAAFSSGGFHGTSMDDVAAAAGVTKPVLYQHFGSKRALYVELLDDVGGQLMDVIAKAAAEADGPHRQVEAGFGAYFHFVEHHEPAFRLLFGGGSKRDEGFADRVRLVEGAIADLIATFISADITAELPAEQILTLAHGIVGMAESTCRQWLWARASGETTASATQLADQLADLAWYGLRGVVPRT